MCQCVNVKDILTQCLESEQHMIDQKNAFRQKG